jgi:maltose alpha-D-glucosyltransferase/alpha-amylase
MSARTAADWYRDAIIYQLHVKSFFDSNGDGIGDFAGVSEKLDYVRDLGATAIWLMPFYPSPLRDDGYDIADYRGVNPAYGAMRDFRRLVREAHARGVRVITELVINHTSDQHPWFQRARQARPGSALRDFYVWSQTDRLYRDARIIFLDSESSNWTWDPTAKAYYWHRFYSHQPDLNFDNPRVLEAVLDTMRHWLDMGVDGLRLDAIPYLIERDGTNCENLPETHAVIRRIRAALDREYPDRMLLAEANQWPEETAAYFGAGDECHMAFHFPLMPRMYMALAMEDRHPITDIMRQTPEIPASAQWAIFLRNHDELTLEMVTDKERDYLWSHYASDSRARINLGIRRRLAPLLANDRRKIELLNFLLLSMPGAPVIYYGDEIGMGDNIYLGDRDGVRTPMQWSPDRNAGFSRADPARLFLPAIQDAVYGYGGVNVEAQLASPASLLNWMRRMIAVRRNYSAFGRGGLRFLYPDNRKILAYLREFENERILCVANVSGAAQACELDLGDYSGAHPVELTGGSRFPPVGVLPYMLTLPAYGFLWLSLDASRSASERFGPQPDAELFTLVLTGGAGDLLRGREGQAFEQNVAPRYLRARRWFAGKSARIQSVRAQALAHLPGPDARRSYLLAQLDVSFRGLEPQSYFAPLAINEESEEDSVQAWAAARVRRGSRIGLAYDADADSAFGGALARAMSEGREFACPQGGRILCFADPAAPQGLGAFESRRLGADQSNSTLTLGEEAVIKIYRRLQKGGNPEVDCVRFLTEGGFDAVPPFYGALVHEAADGARTPLAIMQKFVRNQGDAWTRWVDMFRRAFESLVTAPDEQEPDFGEALADFLPLAERLGARTADMHKAFARPTDDPAFAREELAPADLAHMAQEALEDANKAFDALARLRDPSQETTDLAARVLTRRGEIETALTDFAREPVRGPKIRVHGDYHLGQILIVQHDVRIVDFEGEPARAPEARFAKDTPWRDVAGMMRSIAYAADVAILGIEERLLTNSARAHGLGEAGGAFVAQAFLAAYEAAAEPLLAAPLGEARRLLGLKLLAKALYEIHYEAEFRPQWIGLPLRGVLQSLDRTGAHA